MHDEWILLAIGLVAGTLGGMLGIGGSIIMVPAMTILLGPNQHLYQGAAMMVNCFVVMPSVIHHHRAGAILKSVVIKMVPPAIVAVLIGVWLSKGAWFRGTNEVYLSRLFGCMLFYEAAYNLYRLLARRPYPEMDEATARAIPGWKVALGVGLPTGLVGGLLGVGGGVIATPFQQLVLKIPLRRAIANSAMTIIPLSIIGATYKNYSNLQQGIPFVNALHLALLLVPTAMIGGYYGGRMTHNAPRKVLRVIFIMLMCYAGYALVTRPIPQG